MSRTILQASGISVTLNDVDIVRDASMCLEEGEFVGIIGPNGAGKSTLLKAIRGIVPRVGGTVFLQGKRLEDYTEKEVARELAFMQQDMHVGFGFTAEEVVLTSRYPYLAWWENERKDDYRVVEACMRFTGIYHLRDQIVNRLSGGERQRVLLAKVLAQETPIIFLDEPTASLDLVYQEEIFRYCRSLTRQGKAIVMICHDLEMAARYCSRLVILASGRICADGPPQNVLTAQNLASTFGLQSVVYRNPISGYLDLYTYEKNGPDCSVVQLPIAVVCGGGDASAALLRRLYALGVPLETGPLPEGSVGAYRAQVFGIPMCVHAAAEPISNGDKSFVLFGYDICSESEWDWFQRAATQAVRVYCAPDMVDRFLRDDAEKAQVRDAQWQLISMEEALQREYGQWRT